MNRQQRLISIFNDTQDMIATTPALRSAAEQAARATRLYAEDEWPEIKPASREGAVRVTGRRSFEAAMAIAAEYPKARIAVHNFASPTNPGGGVKNGSSAQEESLCRCSTLYGCLDQRRIWEGYYIPNRGTGDILATDACIWSPGVVICKSDTAQPERLPQDQWVSVDVVTCAAPYLRNSPSNQNNPGAGRERVVPMTELYEVHRKRARHLLTIAAAEGAQCLVLGAFGCGAFSNDPYLVANAWHQEVDALRNHFDLIEFAVFHMPYEQDNYDAFVDEFAQ